MKVAFASHRPFPDGPVRQPFAESDPANIAYVLDGDYYSFFSLGKLSNQQISRKLEPYDLVFVALDHRNFDVAAKVASACEDRLATYSEGGIGDYQLHSPRGQQTFLYLINRAAINFLYWEKYLSFYQSLTSKPVEYLPYPYLIDQAERYRTSVGERMKHVTLPSGLAGRTRNGLSSLTVAKTLLQRDHITRINCWLSTPSAREDGHVIRQFLQDSFEAWSTAPTRLSWRRWLRRSGIDYRPLLQLRNRLFGNRFNSEATALVEMDNLALYTRQAWPRYLEKVAKSLLLIDMNNRESVGRNALDCAALGIACVSTDRSDMQKRLFPDTTVADSWDVQQAITLCERLLQDSSFYQSVIEYASTALVQFSSQSFKRRFEAILQRYPDLQPQRRR